MISDTFFFVTMTLILGIGYVSFLLPRRFGSGMGGPPEVRMDRMLEKEEILDRHLKQKELAVKIFYFVVPLSLLAGWVQYLSSGQTIFMTNFILFSLLLAIEVREVRMLRAIKRVRGMQGED